MARICLKGISISPGIAIGPLRIRPSLGGYEKRNILTDDVETELEIFDQAAQKARQDLRDIIQRLPENVDEYKEIIATQLDMAEDPKIIQDIRARIINRKICASWALEEVILELCALFHDLDDAYLRERAQDIKALGMRLADAINGVAPECDNCQDAIHASLNLSPADVMQLKMDGAIAALTVEGGRTSHAAILTRGLKIPAIAGIKNLLSEAIPNETVIVDSLSGKILLGPDEGEIGYYRHRLKIYNAFERDALTSARWPARTTDGKKITVRANLENTAELASLNSSGAEGIGLYRTEFAFLGGKIPDEETLYQEYCAVLNAAGQQKVIFRILDVGADKIFPLPETAREPNPALGMRGIRFCLKRKDIFAIQLRAIFRAALKGNASIMLPMVSAPAEIDETKKFMAEIKRQLWRENIPFAGDIPLGVMVETPAAALISDSLAKKCDFLSIGTNDLLHYLMAIDRNNLNVAYLHDPMHPAFLRCLKMVEEAGANNGIPVSVCGEIAADPFGVTLLLGLGLKIFSTAPRFTPAIKHMLRKFDSRVCSKLAYSAMHETDTAKTREKLRETLQNCLGSELSFHNILISP